MKCINCENEAKWKSTKYLSPVCSECGRKVVDELLETGEYSLDETAVSDFYERLEPSKRNNNRAVMRFNRDKDTLTFHRKIKKTNA